MSIQTLFSTVHLNGGGNLRTEVLTAPKLKKLQTPEFVYKLPLLAATISPNFMLIHCTVMEKCQQNVSQHTCMHDDLYLTCTFVRGQSQMLATRKLKELQIHKSRRKLPLSAATSTQRFMPFCGVVLKKWHQNVSQCKCV